MDLFLSEKNRAVLRSVRAFCKRELMPIAKDIDQEARFPWEVVEKMGKLAALIAERDIVVLSDEVYEHMVFDGEKHCSVLSHPDLRTRSYAVFSFGKTYHATGWKLAYCVANPTLMGEFRKVHQFVTFTTTSFLDMPVDNGFQ